MEFVAEGEKDAGCRAEVQLRSGEVFQGVSVEGEEDEGGEDHAEQVEEKWGDLAEGGFDEREGAAPDEGYRDQEEVGGEAVISTTGHGRLWRLAGLCGGSGQGAGSMTRDGEAVPLGSRWRSLTVARVGYQG